MTDSTHEFVEKVHEQQEKQRKNQEHYGKGQPNSQLPTKQHGTNK
ncbi:DUF4023 domain-containing protein [Paenibacillus sp. SAF-054]